MTNSEGSRKSKVAAFYLVLDLSESMGPHLSALQNALEDAFTLLYEQSFSAAVARVSVIGFGSNATTLLPLCDISENPSFRPVIKSMGSTEYLSAFQELLSRITEDITSLKKNYLVIRPSILFLTDGFPTDKSDEWLQVRQQLLTPPWRPNILVYGYGSARKEILASAATKDKQGKPYVFMHDREESVGVVLPRLIESLINTIINTSVSVAMNQPQQEIEEPPGFTRIDLDVI